VENNPVDHQNKFVCLNERDDDLDRTHPPFLERAKTELTLTALKPGGYAIIEEPDFNLAMDITGFGESAQNKVNQAICALYEQMGLNPAYGSQRGEKGLVY